MKSSLRSYGWSRHFESRFTELGRNDLLPGRVVQKQRGQLKIRTADGGVDARAAGRRHRAAEDGGLLPVVGDWVALRPAAGSGLAVVEEVLERRNQLSRKAAGARAVEQVVAANVDLVLLVMGLDGDYNLRRLERLLVMAEESVALAPLWS